MCFFKKNNISFSRWDIQDYKAHLEEIKNIRKTYKHFPYLYCYDEKEEIEYQNSYLTAGNNLDAFVALCKGKLIGISIGCPLSKNITICSDLINTDLDIEKPYYFGDIIIDKNFWGSSIAKYLYKSHIEYVENNEFTSILALIVERGKQDPRAPINYRKSNLWKHFNFSPTDITVTYKWNTFSLSNEIKPEMHILRAFEKKLFPTLVSNSEMSLNNV